MKVTKKLAMNFVSVEKMRGKEVAIVTADARGEEDEKDAVKNAVEVESEDEVEKVRKEKEIGKDNVKEIANARGDEWLV